MTHVYGEIKVEYKKLIEMKFSLDRKAVFKKFFKLYCQILERVLTKVAVNFVHFCMASMKISEMQQIFRKIFKLV
jgi:hypothetical protein